VEGVQTVQDAVTVLGDTAGSLGSNLAIVIAAVALALITLAMTLPKAFNSMKTDGINSNVLTRLQAIEEKSAKNKESSRGCRNWLWNQA
jgi:uncharacterized protein with von Willebrand factor type A (vWA) domain